MKLHRNAKIRLIILSLQKFSTVLIIPFMPIYLTKFYDLQTTGLLLTFSVFGSIIAGIISGYYSDNYGRKVILKYSSFTRFFAFFILIISTIPSKEIPIIAVISLFLINLCIGLSIPPSQAMLLDVTNFEQRKFVYTLSYWINNISLSIGTLVGAFLFKDYFWEITIFVTFINLIIYLIIKLLVVETLTTIKNTPFRIKNIILDYTKVIKEKLFLLFIIGNLLTLGLEMQIGNYLSIYLKNEFETSEIFNFKITGIKIYGILQVENALLAIIGAIIISMVLRKITLKDSNQMKIGVLIFSLGFFLLTLNTNMTFLLISMLILTIGEVIYVPMKQTLLAELPKNEDRSKYMALNTVSIRTSAILGTLGIILGSIISPVSMGVIYLMTGLISIFIFSYIFKSIN